MIRVELLGRQRRWWSPWAKVLLSALVVCGGLYGIHQFFPALAGSLFSPDSGSSPVVPQEQEAASSAVEPKLTAQQEAAPDTVVQQEITPKPVAQQAPAPSPVQEAAASPVGQQQITPKAVVQRDTVPSPVAQQETTSSPVQEIESKPAAQQDTLPSPVAQQETASSPVQETAPNPGVQPAATLRPSTSSQRNTACHQVMRIGEQVPTGIRVASLNCNSSGEYWLEGTSPSHKVLREFRLRLQALPSRVSFSTWREERTLRFAFQGRFAERGSTPLDTLSSVQAEQFFGKVAGWADASGLDSLSIHEPIHRTLLPDRTRQRQKLRGIGSPQQIDAFLLQFQQAEAVATLGEVLLMPVQSDESGWVKARLYAAVDIIVEAP